MTAFVDYNQAAINFVNAYNNARANKLRKEAEEQRRLEIARQIRQQAIQNKGPAIMRGRKALFNFDKAKSRLASAKRGQNPTAVNNAQEYHDQKQHEWKFWFENEGKSYISPKASELQFQHTLRQDIKDLVRIGDAIALHYQNANGTPPSAQMLVEAMFNSGSSIVEDLKNWMTDHNKESRAQNAETRAQNAELRSQSSELRAQNRETRAQEKHQMEVDLHPGEITEQKLNIEAQELSNELKKDDIEQSKYENVGDSSLIPYLKIREVDPDNITPENIQQAMADKAHFNALLEGEKTRSKAQAKAEIEKASERPSENMVSLLGGRNGELFRYIAQKNGIKTTEITSDMIRQEGFSLIDDKDGRDLFKRKTGMNEVIHIGGELVEAIQRYGDLSRGPVGGLGRYLTNIESGFRAIGNLFGFNADGSYNQEAAQEAMNQFDILLNSADTYVPEGMIAIAGGHQKAKILTLQLAFALAKAEGLEGRAVTNSILEQRFKPMAASEAYDPQVAIKLLKDVMNISLSRYLIHESTLLGKNVGDISLDSFQLPATPPLFKTQDTRDIQSKTQSELINEFEYLLN